MKNNSQLNFIFENRIIKELFNKYDFINSLIKDNLKFANIDDEHIKIQDNNSLISMINKNKEMCLSVLERLKFILNHLKNITFETITNISNSIENFLKRVTDINDETNIKQEYKNSNTIRDEKENNSELDKLSKMKKSDIFKGKAKFREELKTSEKDEKKIKEKNGEKNNNINEEKKKEVKVESNIIEEKNSEKKGKEEIIEIKEEKMTGKKRLRSKNKKNNNSFEKIIGDEKKVLKIRRIKKLANKNEIKKGKHNKYNKKQSTKNILNDNNSKSYITNNKINKNKEKENNIKLNKKTVDNKSNNIINKKNKKVEKGKLNIQKEDKSNKQRKKLSESPNIKELQNQIRNNKTQKSSNSIKRFKTINNKRNRKSSYQTEKSQRSTNKTVPSKSIKENNEGNTQDNNIIKMGLPSKRKSSRIKDNEIQIVKEIPNNKDKKVLNQKIKKVKGKEKEKHESTPLKNLAIQPKSILKNISKEKDIGKDNNSIIANVFGTSKLLTKFKKIIPTTEIDYDYDFPSKMNSNSSKKKFIHIIEFN